MDLSSGRPHARVETAGTSPGVGVIQGLDDHAEDRESGSLDVGRLWADERRRSGYALPLVVNLVSDAAAGGDASLYFLGG